MYEKSVVDFLYDASLNASEAEGHHFWLRSKFHLSHKSELVPH